jgi:ribosomal protein S18 acetylase RimI-like enzyme
MIHFRPFANRDSPGIVAVWNAQPPARGRLAGLTPAILEQFVLAKPYFDPQGLVVAEDGDRIVGFLHCGFMPGEKFGELQRDAGIICQLLVDPERADEPILAELLRHGEEYLRQQGATILLAGAVGYRGPFYLGLYGGSELPGILQADSSAAETLLGAGYMPYQQRVVMRRSLVDFRAPIDRQFMQLRRQFRLEPIPDTEEMPWYDTCAWCWIERDRFAVVPAAGGVRLGVLTFWDMEPLSSSGGARAAGFLPEASESDAIPLESRLGFLAESMRYYQSQGLSFVEVQLSESDGPAREGFRRLGFQEIDRGVQFRKSG